MESKTAIKVETPVKVETALAKAVTESPPKDDFDRLRREEANARVIRVQPLPDEDFLLDDREKAALELVNCNLARALSITEEEKAGLVTLMTQLRSRLNAKEKEVAEIERRREVLQSSVDLLKVLGS